MITADLTIIPLDKNTNCREYITEAVQVIKDSHLNYKLTGMGTQIEAKTLEELYQTITQAQEAVFKKGTGRVYTIIKIDDRRDQKNQTLNQKIKKVQKKLK